MANSILDLCRLLNALAKSSLTMMWSGSRVCKLLLLLLYAERCQQLGQCHAMKHLCSLHHTQNFLLFPSWFWANFWKGLRWHIAYSCRRKKDWAVNGIFIAVLRHNGRLVTCLPTYLAFILATLLRRSHRLLFKRAWPSWVGQYYVPWVGFLCVYACVYTRRWGNS